MKGMMRLALLGLLLVPLIQGCVPLIATGAVGTGLVAADRRTSGTQLDDQEIQIRVERAITGKYGDQVANVSANSFNRIVLLTGQVADEAMQKDVEALARAVTNVREVVNKTRVTLVSSISQRASDAYLSTKVSARFMAYADDKFSPIQVDVVSENATVYLMGFVTQPEADAATDLASTTSGVKQVVRVFEIIGTSPAGAAQAQVQPETIAVKPNAAQPPAPVQDALPATTTPVAP